MKSNQKLRQYGSEALFEFCCDENSALGQVNAEYGVDHFRLTEANSDVSNPAQIKSLEKLVSLFPGSDLWGSIPCGPWSRWQGFNQSRLGTFREKLRKQRARSRNMLKNFIAVLSQGGHVSFEWPRDCYGCALPELASFIERHNLYEANTEANTDGCAHGMVEQDGVPHLNRWRIGTSCWKLAENLSAKRCTHSPGFKHSSIEGSKMSRTALYPKPMAYTIIHSLYPRASAVCAAMPVTPFVQHAAIHQPIERNDWHKHAGVQECVDGEVKELISKGTWDYEEVVPRKDLLARKEPLNIGYLMTLLSIKHFA